MTGASSRVVLPAEVAAKVDEFLSTCDTAGLARYLSLSMSNITDNEKTKAVVHYVAACLPGLAASKGADVAVAVGDGLLALNGLRDVAFGRELYALLIALAGSCLAVGAYATAERYDLRVLNAPANMEMHVRPAEKLACVQRLLACAQQTGSAAVADAATFSAMPLYRRARGQLAASRELEAAGLALLAFLEALAASMQRRCLFAGASRVFAERHERSGDAFDFERAAVCALLAEAGPARSRLIEGLHLAPESRGLGDLGELLAKAFHSQAFRPRDVAVLQRSRAVAAAKIPQEAVRAAVNQHNIAAIAKVYSNISFAGLAGKLDEMEAAAAAAAVAQMVSEGRLAAKVDQAAAWITFPAGDDATAMTEWDARLGVVCNAMSHAAELITMQHPDLRSYLQEET